MIKHILVAFALVAFGTQVYADSKPAPKIDCTQKKNASKIQCKKAPESKIEDKAKVKKPIKVRKAPKDVQKKAEQNTK
jgi:hypothetical protein